jgi:hypothetical protein
MLERWKKAVLHLEGATDEESPHEQFRRMIELQKAEEEGRVTPEEIMTELNPGIKTLRYHGTAVFLAHEGKRYLLTARHVLHDKDRANQEISEERRRTEEAVQQGFPLQIANDRIRATQDREMMDEIFGVIFRVPTLDEVWQRSSEK